MRYFKTSSEEDDRGTEEDWGSCTYYLEFDDSDKIHRIVEIYQNGNRRLSSSDEHRPEGWQLLDQMDIDQIHLSDYLQFEIQQQEFMDALSEATDS